MYEPILGVIGAVLLLFLPGTLLSFFILHHLKPLDRFLVGFGLSVAICALVFFILGTGAFGSDGINALNLWVSLVVVSMVIGVFALVQRR